MKLVVLVVFTASLCYEVAAYSETDCDVEVLSPPQPDLGPKFQKRLSLSEGKHTYSNGNTQFLYQSQDTGRWILGPELGGDLAYMMQGLLGDYDEPTDVPYWEYYDGESWSNDPEIRVRKCGQTGERLLTITVESASNFPDMDYHSNPDAQVDAEFYCPLGGDCVGKYVSTKYVSDFNPVWNKPLPSAYYSSVDCNNANLILYLYDKETGDDWEYVDTIKMWCKDFGTSKSYTLDISPRGTIKVKFDWGPVVKARCYASSFYFITASPGLKSTCTFASPSTYYEEDERCQVSCKQGYDGNDGTFVTCVRDNEWDNYVEDCRLLGLGCSKSDPSTGYCSACKDPNADVTPYSCICKPGYLNVNDNDTDIDCQPWDCFAPNLSFGHQIADMKHASQSQEVKILRRVLLCAFAIDAPDAAQKQEIIEIIKPLQSNAYATDTIKRDAATFLKSYWTSIAGDQVPPFDEQFYKERMDQQIEYLQIFQSTYQTSMDNANFASIFALQKLKTSQLQVEIDYQVSDLLQRIKDEKHALSSNSQTVAETMPKLQLALFEVKQALKSPWNFLGPVFDFVEAVVSLDPGAALSAVTDAVSKGFAIHTAMQALSDLMQEVNKEFPDYKVIATSKSGTQWNNFVLEIEQELRGTCLGADSDAQTECYGVLLRVKQMALFGQDAYNSQVTIKNYQKELEMVNLRKDHLSETAAQVKEFATSQSTLTPDQQWEAKFLAQQILTDNLYQARYLLQSYCLSIAYKFPPATEDATSCRTAVTGASGGPSQLVSQLVQDLVSVQKRRDSSLLATKGSSSGRIGMVDITHLFDFEALAQNFDQTFKLEPGSIPVVDGKLGVEVEQVEVFFDGVTKRSVDMQVELLPPFLKEWGSVESDPHKFSLAPFTFPFSYVNDITSCTANNIVGSRCITSMSPPSVFAMPTPYCTWTIKLNQFTAEYVNQITKVWLNIKYKSTGSHSTLQYTPKSRSEWGPCTGCSQERSVYCEVKSLTKARTELHRSVCEFQDKVIPYEQCCDTGVSCPPCDNATTDPRDGIISPAKASPPISGPMGKTCSVGADGCECTIGGACDPGLTCNNDHICTCHVASKGCPCTQGGSCESGLTCENTVCVEKAASPTAAAKAVNEVSPASRALPSVKFLLLLVTSLHVQ